MARAEFYATDGEFFQVIRETAKGVIVRPVKAERTGYEHELTCYDTEVEYRALPEQFTTSWWLSDRQNEVGKRCKVKPGGDICINGKFLVFATPCDGVKIFNHYYS